MASCQLGVFEYQFVYIQWTATSLGAIVGVLGGLFVGMLLLGVAVVVHQLYLAKKQSNTSLKDQLISLCASGKEERSNVSEVFSHSTGGSSGDWPNFHIPCRWDDIPVSTEMDKTALSDGGVVTIMDRASSAQGHFVLPCFPMSLPELLGSVNHSSASADLAALQSTDALDANIHLLAVLCEGFFLLKDAQLRSGVQNFLQEAVQQVEEVVVELRKAVRTRENLLAATTHEGLDKRMEALLQWEKEWLLLAFDMVGALYKGVCLLDDAEKREECDGVPGYKTLWSQFQIECVQQVELRVNQWLPVWHRAKEEAVSTVLSGQATFEQMMKSAIDHVLDQVQKSVNEADLPETAMEQILSHASSYLEQLRVKVSKTGLSLSEVPGAQWSGNMDCLRKELRKLCKQVDTPFDKALPTYLMRVSAEWKTYEEDKLHELGTFLEEALANQQAWHSGLLEELSGFSWLLGAKEHRHLAGLKQTVVGACQEHLGDCRAQLKTWADSHRTVKTGAAATHQAASHNSGGTPLLINESFTDGVKETPADSLPGLCSATQSSVAVVSKMVEGMLPELRMKSAHLLTQHSANAEVLHFQLTCSLERLTKCAKWLLAHLWARGKQKHHRKASPKEGEEETHDKQLQVVLESFQSLLEKQGIDFIKSQEEELEKEFEEMRQEAEKEARLEEKEQQALTAVKDHMMSHAAETSGMMHLVSERILQEHQTAVRKIQADMEKTRQHQLMIMQQKLQARKLHHERMMAQTTEDLKAISPNSAVGQALLQLLMDVRQRRAEKEFRRELEEEHKRELALLEAKLNQQMKHKLKSQEVRMIQSMAHACKLSNEQLAAEISRATAGMGDVSEQIICEIAQTEAPK